MEGVNWGIKEFKAAFFDAEKIKSALDAGLRGTLSQAGAFVQRRAKSSIRNAPRIDVRTGQVTRKRKNVETRPATAPPGHPPYSHEGSLRRRILFGYDTESRSEIIGPAFFKTGRVRELLEHGGDATLRTKSGKTRQVHYRGNAFMRPAGEAETPKFRALLKGMIN